MKTHLLVYDPDVLVDHAMPSLISRMPGVHEAYWFFGNAICIKSDNNSAAIVQYIQQKFSGLQFFLVEVDKAEKAYFLPERFEQFLHDRVLESAAE